MKKVPLEKILENFNSKDLSNICYLLNIDDTPSVKVITNKIKWLYHSKTAVKIEHGIKKLTNKIKTKIFLKHQNNKKDYTKHRKVPTYNELILGACKHLKVYSPNASIEEHELYLSHDIIISALYKMSPQDRIKFFQQEIQLPEKLTVKGSNLRGPVTTFAVLGLAKASGFGIYVYSTTALGFITHAIGKTLPFVVYTSMTRTIAFLIGPAGWLATGVWGIWKIIQPKWEKIIPVLVYIIAVKSTKKILNL